MLRMCLIVVYLLLTVALLGTNGLSTPTRDECIRAGCIWGPNNQTCNCIEKIKECALTGNCMQDGGCTWNQNSLACQCFCGGEHCDPDPLCQNCTAKQNCTWNRNGHYCLCYEPLLEPKN
jgi:hypothetical protein